ncbi:phage major capsid protein [Planomonospora sp. ID82291]|uniref:phage major capsid protein n=1 Tax=Planomonospora sp. ID82291 TaxID=2738136 RepID=UPI0018C408F4|nr:phage major capsid protein [Planomonospora sp. ID82291]MBG0818762.1 phage major capsid protein [Planomonospora sp. ID82291]
MTATASKAHLKDLEARLQTKAADIERIRDSITDETGRGHLVMTKEQHADYLKAVDSATEIQALIIAEKKALGIAEYLEAPSTSPVAGHLAAASGRGNASRSFAQAWLESPEFLQMKSSGFREIRGITTFEQGLYSFETKDIFSLSAGTVTHPGFGMPEHVGLTERVRRPSRVRDLFPAESTQANVLYGVRQVGFVNNAGFIPERTAAGGGAATGGPTDIWGKSPRSGFTYESYTAPIAEIGHHEVVHKNTLADESRLRGILERDLIDGVKLKEDEAILFGNGAGESILGITQTPGVQMYTGLASDKRTAQIRRAMTLAILSYYDPNGIILHPLDFEGVELEEDKQGAFRVAVSVAIGAEKRVWRLNVIDTPAMQSGKFLLGSFGQGAKLYDRETVVVQASTETGNSFLEGTVVIKASERVGLAVDRPESFVYGSFTPYTGA